MASTVTITLNKLGRGRVFEIICDWALAATQQWISQNIAEKLYSDGKIDKAALTGNILAIETIPGTNGVYTPTAMPTAVMSHTYKDGYGFDLGESVFLNQATSTAYKSYCNPPIMVNGEIQLNIASIASTTAQGRDILWIEVF